MDRIASLMRSFQRASAEGEAEEVVRERYQAAIAPLPDVLPADLLRQLQVDQPILAFVRCAAGR